MAIYVINKEHKTSFIISEDEIREVLKRHHAEIKKLIVDTLAIEMLTEYNMPIPKIHLSNLDIEEAADKALNSIFKQVQVL
jgi:hypothetical protein